MLHHNIVYYVTFYNTNQKNTEMQYYEYSKMQNGDFLKRPWFSFLVEDKLHKVETGW